MRKNNILAVSFIAMLAVSSARATVVTQTNVVGGTNVSVSVNDANKLKVSAPMYGEGIGAADAVAKTVQIDGITSLEPGQVIFVKPKTTSTVANSTLNLNGLGAKDMMYNNAAITTSTDSIVWNANYVSIFVYDGAAWQFAGHGLDSNTTYSAMTVSEGRTATATNARTMRADYLKQIVQGTSTTAGLGQGSVLGPDYAKSTATGTNLDVAKTDTVTGAIGKLEKKADDAAAAAAAAATAQVNADWNATSGKAQILNKPTLGTAAAKNATDTYSAAGTDVVTGKAVASAISGKANSADLATVATSGSYNDLTNKPTIPAAQVNSDWNATSGKAQILNKPTLATVATSGSYSDLSNKPATLSGTELTGTGTTGRLITGAQYGAKQDVQIGATKVSGADSTNKNEVVIADADGKIALSGTKLGGSVASGNTGLVTGGDVYTAINTATATGNFIEDSITDGTTDKAPSENAVYDALANKQDKLGGTNNGNKVVVTTTTPGTVTYRGIDTTSIGSSGSTALITSGAVYTGLSGKVPTGRKVNGKTLVSDVTLTGADIATTGYAKADSVEAIEAGDSVNVALGKLEKALDGKQAALTIDTAMSSSSTNPVQNKVVNTALSGKVNVAQGSTNKDKVMITNASGQVVPVAITNDGTGVVTGVSISNGTVTVSKSAIGAANVASGLVTGTAPIAVSRNDSTGVYTVSANAGAVVDNTTATAGGGGALIKGQTVYNEVRPAQTNGTDGTGYLGAPASTTAAANLTALDTAIKEIHPKDKSVKIPSGSETASNGFASIWVE